MDACFASVYRVKIYFYYGTLVLWFWVSSLVIYQMFLLFVNNICYFYTRMSLTNSVKAKCLAQVLFLVGEA